MVLSAQYKELRAEDKKENYVNPFYIKSEARKGRYIVYGISLFVRIILK